MTATLNLRFDNVSDLTSFPAIVLASKAGEKDADVVLSPSAKKT